MEQLNLDRSWTFRRGWLDSLSALRSDPGTEVNLPHDGMIGTPVSPDAPGRHDTGYFAGGLTNYTKYVTFPKEWEGDCVGLLFDGAMMHASVDINGCKVGAHHYGYAPFYVDLTDYAVFGEENRITVNLNTGVHGSSRWYTGSGLFRSVKLCHSPRVHIAPDGIYVYTKELTSTHAFLEAQVDIVNASSQNRLAEVTLTLTGEHENKEAAKTVRVIQVNPGKTETARMTLSLEDPALWDAEHPNLYLAKASVKNLGVYRTHFTEDDEKTTDEASALFGVRMISADSVRGLRINQKTVKLKGGCLHHDNGLLGAVSLYESEARKIRKMKELGFNAIRTTHNPPSAALIEACDRLGMYVFDEAFDAWGIGKRSGDYNQYFDSDWEKDLTAFVLRDRIHPSVVIWSTGNEIPERAGLNNGYTLAAKLAEKVRSLDATRPVSNGICSLWSGLDDHLAEAQNQAQNAAGELSSFFWEKQTEPFTNGLDIVGYNYGEDMYEQDHLLYPERVMLGSENFPKEIGFRWPMVEKLPYVIGDFTWTAWDYLGEAGIGKAIYVDAEDPRAGFHPWDLMPDTSSPFPWRTANDADIDLTGQIRPQGAYRSVVFGSTATHLFAMPPETFGRIEVVSMWGFPVMSRNWNYEAPEGKPIRLIVFSAAEEAEVFVNGSSIGRKPVGKDRPYPNAVAFDTVYTPGKIEAVSYRDGREISRDLIETCGAPAKLLLTPEKTALRADGHDLVYVDIAVVDAKGRVVNDAAVPLRAACEGSAVLAGFGSGNPVTDEDYTDDRTTTYMGHALAILRSNYGQGPAVLTVTGTGFEEAVFTVHSES